MYATIRSARVRFHAALHGAATFETMKHWLRVDIQGDGRGHFLAQCEACDKAGVGNSLRFELSFDQTELPPVLAAFPVKGNP